MLSAFARCLSVVCLWVVCGLVLFWLSIARGLVAVLRVDLQVPNGWAKAFAFVIS